MNMDFEKLKGYVRESREKQSKWRKCTEEDFAFVAGHQWSDVDKTRMEDNNRQPIVFNRVAVILSSVAGSEINNRTEVSYIPREIGDVKVNEVLSAGAQWFRDQGYAEDAESQSFSDMLTCGIGVTDTTLSFDENPEGDPEIERVDPVEFGWDPSDRTKGLSKSRYKYRVRQMSIEDAQERFPKYEPAELDAAWAGAYDPTTGVTNPDDDYEDRDLDTREKGCVTVVQIQCRTREDWVEYVDPQTGKREEMPASKWKIIADKSPVLPSNRAIKKTVWTQYFLGAEKILDTNQPDPDGCTFNVMTGLWDAKDKQFYGLLRSMKDPQMYANKWLSQVLHIINTNAKGGVIVEEGAIDDVNAFTDDWAASDSVTIVKNGGLGKIQEKGGPDMPAALMSLTEFSISSIRDVSGVNQELLGMRDANQAGVLEYQRRQSAMTTLAVFFDSLRFYRKRQGRTILNFIANYLAPMGAMVRIVKDDQEQYVELAVDDKTTKYDVIVDDAPQAPNEKEKSWAVIQQMMPLLQNAGLGMEDWADILEYSPLPSSFADKVRQKASEQKDQGPSPEQQAMMQLEIQKTQSEIMENQSNAQLDQMRAAQVAQETQLAPAQVYADLYKPMTPNSSQ